MITLSHECENGVWTVYGTRIVNGHPVTRPFEHFKTKKGAENYITKYEAKQTEYYSKKRG